MKCNEKEQIKTLQASVHIINYGLIQCLKPNFRTSSSALRLFITHMLRLSKEYKAKAQCLINLQGSILVAKIVAQRRSNASIHNNGHMNRHINIDMNIYHNIHMILPINIHRNILNNIYLNMYMNIQYSFYFK